VESGLESSQNHLSGNATNQAVNHFSGIVLDFALLQTSGATMGSCTIEQAFARLKLLKPFDFQKRPVLTQEQQEWVQVICDRYIGALPDERARFRSMITPEISFLFFMYAGLMAVQAVRERQQEKVFQGLVALAVENQVFDWRVSMMVLAKLHHSAVKIGADPSQLFEQAAAISASQASQGFLQFSTRASEDLDIAKFGWIEGTDSEGNFAYLTK
jgi:hypothetical protein